MYYIKLTGSVKRDKINLRLFGEKESDFMDKNSSVRLVASDIDGTLLRGESKTISDQLFKQVYRLKEQGIRFCAASGRQHKSLRGLFKPVEKDILFLCENGAICFDEKGNVLSKTPVDRETALGIAHEILEVPQFEVLISGAETSYLIPKSHDFIDHIQYFVGNHVTLIDRPEDIREDILKVSAYCPDGALQYQQPWREKWGKKVQIALGGSLWLDCGVASKREGINGICAALGISPKEVMAFGDNYNDLPMLETVGHPYLMESASDELKGKGFPLAPSPETVIEKLLSKR